MGDGFSGGYADPLLDRLRVLRRMSLYVPHGPRHGPLGDDPTGIAPWDLRNGIFWYDDFSYRSSGGGFALNYDSFLPGGGLIEYNNQNAGGGTFGLDTIRRAQGYLTFSTWTGTGSGQQGVAISRGLPQPNSGYLLGFGTCELSARLGIMNSGAQPGSALNIKFGFWNDNQSFGTTGVGPWGNPRQGACFMEWSCDANGGAMRIGYNGATNNVPSYVNFSSGSPTFNNFDWWTLRIDSSGNATALLNGIVIGTASAVAPLAPLTQVPFLGFSRGLNVATNYELAVDDMMMYYPYNRR
jgi:hypothetical protein